MPKKYTGKCISPGCERECSGYYPRCHAHRYRWSKHGIDGGPIRARNKVALKCARQGCEKKAHCKGVCQNHYSKKLRDDNPKEWSIRKRVVCLKKFGMTPESHAAMLAAQGGVCLICKNPQPSRRALAVDHCHTTKRVRGLLCSNCNTAIGLLKDDVRLLESAIAYLRATAEPGPSRTLHPERSTSRERKESSPFDPSSSSEEGREAQR